MVVQENPVQCTEAKVISPEAEAEVVTEVDFLEKVMSTMCLEHKSGFS